MSLGLYEVVLGICTFVGFLGDVALLVTALTVVRSRRPDAYSGIAIAATIFVVGYVLRAILSTTMSFVSMRAGLSVGSAYAYPVAISVLSAIIGILGTLFLIIGVVKLASAPNDLRPLHLPPGA